MGAFRWLAASCVLVPVAGLFGCNSVTGIDNLEVGTGGARISTSASSGRATSSGEPTTTSSTGGSTSTGTLATSSSTSSASSTSTSSSTSGSATTSGSSNASASSSSSASSSTSASSTSSSGNPLNQAAQDCVDTINSYRATVSLPPLARLATEEVCAGQEAQKDAATMTAHSAFGMCSENGQNECPGWPGPPDAVVKPCLAAMWAEGPGPFNQGHGHYDNMTSTSYTKVACGFYTLSDGSVWATQDFFP